MSDDKHTEELLRRALVNVLSVATNYPEGVVPHILGRDTAPLREKVVAAILPVIVTIRADAEVAILRKAADTIYLTANAEGLADDIFRDCANGLIALAAQIEARSTKGEPA